MKKAVFNATNEGVSMGELLAGSRVTWVTDSFLLEQGVGEWMELPLWLASPEYVGMHRVRNDRAVAAGLTFRPLEEIARGALEEARPTAEAGMKPERERKLLEAWQTRS